MSLLGQMIRATNFKQFMDFASPSFFDVVPSRHLWGQGRALLRAYRDKEAFRAAVEQRQDEVRAFGVQTDVDGDKGAQLSTLGSEERGQVGRRILEVYFHQILTQGPVLLDLSLRRWSRRSGDLVWHPGRGHHRFDDRFRESLAEVYLSFYLNEGDLDAALDRLGLSVATDLFLKHFGDGDQRAVNFTVDHFTSSFHQVFVRCREHGVELDPEFLPLGIYLATLYESLSSLGIPLDVREAFEVAAKSRAR